MSTKKTNSVARGAAAQTVGERMRILRGGLNRADFAAMLNVSAAYVAMIEAGKRLPSQALMELISLKFKVSRNWLHDGSDAMAEGENNNRAAGLVAEDATLDWGALVAAAPERTAPENLVSINIYDFELLENTSRKSLRTPLESVILPERFAKSGALGFKMTGESMAPNIAEGAFFGLAYRDVKAADGAVYAVRLKNRSVLVRRVFRSGSGMILRPDNNMFPELSVGPAEAVILGRVGWVFQQKI